MPMLIWTISDYFFYKRKDLYAIKFTEIEGGHSEDDFIDVPIDLSAREMLLNWFEENLPEVEIQPIYLFLSDSGIISAPYAGSISVEFDEQSLAKFMARWEDENGKSVDSRFQCYCYPLEGYIQHNNGEIPDPTKFYENL